MHDSAIIEIIELTKVYGMGKVEVRALNEVNLTIRKGEFVAVMGPSGSGKSTLMSILGCLDRPTSGQYLLAGEDVSNLDKSGRFPEFIIDTIKRENSENTTEEEQMQFNLIFEGKESE